MLEQLQKNKRLWIAGAIVIVLLVIGIIVIACIYSGSGDSKGMDNQVEVGKESGKKPENEPSKKTEKDSSDSGLTVTGGDGKDAVIDGSGSWDATGNSDKKTENQPSGDSSSKPSGDSNSKPSDDNNSKPSDDNNSKPSDDNNPSEKNDISEEGTLDDGKQWTMPL